MRTTLTTLLLAISIFGQSQTTAKRITVTYTGGEFLGYCIWHFKDLQGNEHTFYNDNLGGYSEESGCRMKTQYEKDTFEMMYKLTKLEIYNEDIGRNQTTEKEVITDMRILNPSRNTQINNQAMNQCQKTVDSLVAEIKKYNNGNNIPLNTKPDSPDKCEGSIKALQNYLGNLIQAKERADKIAAEQKALAPKGCNNCILTTTKKFLQACIDTEKATIKSTLSKCCYDANANCSHIGSIRPLKYSKLVEKPDVNAAKWYLDRKDKFFIYYCSESIAIVMVKETHKGITLVKEAGAWKVLSTDEQRNADIINFMARSK